MKGVICHLKSRKGEVLPCSDPAPVLCAFYWRQKSLSGTHCLKLTILSQRPWWRGHRGVPPCLLFSSCSLHYFLFLFTFLRQGFMYPRTSTNFVCSLDFFEPLILLSLLGFMELGIKSRTLCMLGKHSTNWATSPASSSCYRTDHSHRHRMDLVNLVN